jgi:hypothetical protein
MKIHKIAQNYKMIQQNPTGQVDTGVQLQNLQNSQQALQFLQNAMTSVSELLANVSKVDDALGMDTGLRSIVEQKANEAIMKSPAFDLLSKMGLVADIKQLYDTSKFAQLQQMITRNIQDFSTGQTQNTQQNIKK